jgi:hypothetical protein
MLAEESLLAILAPSANFPPFTSVPFRWLALPVAEGRVGATPEVINQLT